MAVRRPTAARLPGLPLACAAWMEADPACHLNHRGPSSTCPQPQALGIPAGAGWRLLFARTPQPVLRTSEIMKGGKAGRDLN